MTDVVLPVLALAGLVWDVTRAVGLRTSAIAAYRSRLAAAFPLMLLLIVTLGVLRLALEPPAGEWIARHIWPLVNTLYLLGRVRARTRLR